MTEFSEKDVRSFEIQFTKEDEERLRRYFGLADAVGALFGKHCEVVIHSFHDFSESVVKIVNGEMSSRSVGAPITDFGLRVLKEFLETGNRKPKTYFTKSKTGSLVKSSSTLLFGHNGNPIGMFCMNVDLSAPFIDFMESFLRDANSEISTENEVFASNPDDVIGKAVASAVRTVEGDPSVSVRSRNKTIVNHLYQNGIFNLKSAVKEVATRLDLTEHAVYKYIREFQNSSGPSLKA